MVTDRVAGAMFDGWGRPMRAAPPFPVPVADAWLLPDDHKAPDSNGPVMANVHLVGYAKGDLLLPDSGDLAVVNEVCRQRCVEVNVRVHAEIWAVATERPSRNKHCSVRSDAAHTDRALRASQGRQLPTIDVALARYLSRPASSAPVDDHTQPGSAGSGQPTCARSPRSGGGSITTLT